MVPKASPYPVDLLLVEDNPADARLTQEALKEGALEHTLHHVTDGKEAMDFLTRRGDYEDAPRPDLVLLDLNLPRKNGHEVLAEMKADPELCDIPVVVLTTSNDQKDIAKSYKLQASSFVNKPVDVTRFFERIKSLQAYWLETAMLPAKS